MKDVCCREDISLTEKEKEVFSIHLEHYELSYNIWDLFQEWVSLSNSEVRFFYLKVYQMDTLIGLGLFLRIKPYDLKTSYSPLRPKGPLNTLASLVSAVSRNCVYISLRNLITANITRPFFYAGPEVEGIVMNSILSHLKNEKEADMVSILDTSENDNCYENMGFHKYPSPSESWLEATRYGDISEYLDKHRSLKKNLSRRKNRISTDIYQGSLSNEEKRQIKECLDCSIKNSRVYNPCQKFFEENIFTTQIFNSHKYVHIFIRLDNRIVGFHTYQVSGSNMGGVLGGFNREFSRKNFLYERVMVASLDYAIKHKIKRVYYSLIDNYTKLRLVDSLEPCGLYFYARNPVNRRIFNATFKFNDVYELYCLEKEGLMKYGS